MLSPGFLDSGQMHRVSALFCAHARQSPNRLCIRIEFQQQGSESISTRTPHFSERRESSRWIAHLIHDLVARFIPNRVAGYFAVRAQVYTGTVALAYVTWVDQVGQRKKRESGNNISCVSIHKIEDTDSRGLCLTAPAIDAVNRRTTETRYILI